MKLSSVLSKMKSAKHVHIHSGPGLGAEIVGTGVYVAASEIFGYVHGRYRDKAEVMGVPANLLVGVLGKLSAIALYAQGGKLRNKAHYLNNIANAGIGSYVFADGVARGTRAAGRKIYVLESGGTPPSLGRGLTQTDVVGEIPQAMGGAYLSREELESLKNMK